MNDSLMHLCVPDDVCSIYPNHINWILKSIREERTCFIVKNNKEECGCAIVKDSSLYNNMLKICFFYIIPCYRNRGLGASLLSYIEQFAYRKEYKGVYITVNKCSIQMQSFMESKNYTKYGEAKNGDTIFRIVF